MATYMIFDINSKNKFPCNDDETILEGAEKAGLDYPYSSRSGQDLTSAAQLVMGNVRQLEDTVLSQYYIDRGYFLMDTAYPLDDCVIRSHMEENVKDSWNDIPLPGKNKKVHW